MARQNTCQHEFRECILDKGHKIYAIMIRGHVLQIQELKTQYKQGASVLDTRVEIHASTRRGHVFWISIGQYEQVTSVLDTIGEMKWLFEYGDNAFGYKSEGMYPYEQRTCVSDANSELIFHILVSLSGKLRSGKGLNIEC